MREITKKEQALLDIISDYVNRSMNQTVFLFKLCDYDFSKFIELEEKINRFRTKLKKEHLKSVEKKEYSYQTGIIYNDLYCECEKLADFAINVSEAIEEINH